MTYADPGGDAAAVESIAREFFSAIDERDPRRLHATLAEHATFRALPHNQPIRPATEIVEYFGSVVSSYPTARWEVTDVIAGSDRASIQFVVREYSSRLGRDLISEQVAIFRVADGLIVSIVGYYDAAEFRKVFWDEA